MAGRSEGLEVCGRNVSEVFGWLGHRIPIVVSRIVSSVALPGTLDEVLGRWPHHLRVCREEGRVR